METEDKIPPEIPWTVMMAAGLCCLLAGQAVAILFGGALAGEVRIEFTLLLLPAGFILVRGGRTAWLWMVFFSSIMLLLLVWNLVSEPLRFLNHAITIPERNLWVAWSEEMLHMIFFLTIPVLLLHVRTRRWFRKSVSRNPGSGWWIAVPLAAGLWAGTLRLKEAETAANFYPVDLRIRVLNEVTGNPVKGFAVTCPGSSGDDYGMRGARRKVSFSWEGEEFALRGVAGEPFNLTITAEGMKSSVFEVTRKTGYSKTVYLKPAD